MNVKIVRSSRRKKTVSAKVLPDGTLEVQAPARIPKADLDRIISGFEQRLTRRAQRQDAGGDEALNRRAQELNAQFFDGKLRWRSIRYVANQQQRFGSCTPLDGTLRISERVAGLPAWIRDYVIVHELAHLIESNHSPAFWQLVNRYPKAERARGYLMALGLEGDAEDNDNPAH
ncbi:MAG: metal-dependent hydrolase [Chloroflexi bacterium RBG_16_57_9]|nr:MAG: metal-dependent hydrolase [Chloroflexi bacterium RBG_16_57_9]